jgi:hypothetical protein
VKVAMTKCTGEQFEKALQAVKMAEELSGFLSDLFSDKGMEDQGHKADPA